MLLISRKIILDANGFGEDRQAGSLLILKALSAGGTVSITWVDDQYRNAGTVNGVGIGDKLHAGGEFFGYQIQGIAGATVDLLIGPDAADAGSTLQAALTIGHVITDAGSVAAVTGPLTDAQLRATPVPISSTEVLAGVLTNVVPVAATAAITALLAANAARRSFRVRNLGPDSVALVGAAGTFADAAIILLIGETWIEREAAAAAWYCICDAAKTATINILMAT